MECLIYTKPCLGVGTVVFEWGLHFSDMILNLEVSTAPSLATYLSISMIYNFSIVRISFLVPKLRTFR